jgi:hypothetical protein
MTENEMVTIANAEDIADSDDNVVDSGDSTDDEEGKENISDPDGDGATDTDVQQHMINYNQQK